jgi:ArsR family transcriptional regulator
MHEPEGWTAMDANSRFSQEDRCDCDVIHMETVRAVLERMPEEADLFGLAELFKIFGDSTRIRILSALFVSEMCVCDLAYLLNMTQSAISHQLRVLRQSKLIGNRKEGKNVYYFLADEHVQRIVDQGLSHVVEA